MSTAVFGAPGFKARNGMTVREGDDGSLKIGNVDGYLSQAAAFAADEYFQAKHDDELGRWRDPLEPQCVVYPLSGEMVRVVDERDGLMVTALREEMVCAEPQGVLRRLFKAAWAYFEAHPGRKLPTEPGTVLQGTGPNRSILHRSYPVNGHEPERPWASLAGATYDDEGAWTFFHGGQFVVLVRPGDAS